VDKYYEGLLLPKDEVVDKTLESSHEASLLQIEIFRLQGQFMTILLASIGAKRVLEIGTLGGFSAICMARSLPEDGKLITLEIDESAAAVARANFERAGLSKKIELIVGRAADSLAALKKRGDVFDFVFVDADKPSNPIYLDFAMSMTHATSLICVDNVVRDGNVVTAGFDPRVDGCAPSLSCVRARCLNAGE
jgi:predicted O-methyltransferase YrrM